MTEAELLGLIRRVAGISQQHDEQATQPDSVTAENYVRVVCNQVNHLIPTRVLVKGGEITCKILK